MSGGPLQPLPPPDDDVAALRRQLEEAREQVLKTASVIDSTMQKQEADDRSMITRVVIQVFGFSIAGVLAVIGLLAMLSGHYADAQDRAIDLLKSVVLPIVTLVLGYYFGRAGKG